jgi:hypothetical protein
MRTMAHVVTEVGVWPVSGGANAAVGVSAARDDVGLFVQETREVVLKEGVL